MEKGTDNEMHNTSVDQEVPPHLVLDGTHLTKMKRVDSMELESNHVKGMEQHKVITAAMTLKLAFQTIGVVYGDVGTSPLYVFSSTFPNGINPDHVHKDVLGALSLIIYTLTLIPLIKYVLIVLRANDRGEGGTFALYSLICRYAKVSLISSPNSEDRKLSGYQIDLPSKALKRSSRLKDLLEKSEIAKRLLLLLALLGTCMVIGDGVLTPAISVLSAVEGIKVQATHLSQNVIVIVSVIILVALFSLQRLGTDKVGILFAPCVLVWFLFIGIIGLYNIFHHDAGIFRAFNPKYMYLYFKVEKKEAWKSLGGVVLCITGTEAMFADLGHFSVKSIQIAFTSLVYPCLLLAYIGQAAYLLKYPEHVDEAFYKSIPSPVYWPQFVVAIIAAIIASQAMISATFSIIKQSMALGCFPRVKIIHTSTKHAGQIYIPEMNWLLMVICVVITVAFRNTDQIGNAYGICVVSVMLVTTSLLGIIFILIWKTHIMIVLAFLLIFGSVELFYLTSVLEKFTKGGWLPLCFAGVFLSVMVTWYYGSAGKYQYEVENKVSPDTFKDRVAMLSARLPGVGLICTQLPHGIPATFSHFINSVPAIHSVLVFVCVKHLPVNNVLEEERFLFRRVSTKECRTFRCVARYGYRDTLEENQKFEKLLFKSLAQFIESEATYFDQPSNSIKFQSIESTVIHIDGYKIPPLNQISSGSKNCDEAFNVEYELAILEKARNEGVIYIVGDSDVKASKGSSLPRKFLINCAFNFLHTNFRESVDALDIPYTKLLKVGTIQYI
ncbi:hypothetical protein O6H91_06G143500 [Diphasiastrum complanatum]|uniref:Uncharacterized protein n=1 Tax=Diphasiastrum complanatum TaxID=34168 RepID=A0ACC2DJR8_DIPCM|nr:hypothetical protein O6H91_06G143500 [Diphasiastrum complanatum]